MDEFINRRPAIKDSLTCPHCKKDIVNKERKMISSCPFCECHLFAVMWMEKDVIQDFSDKLKANKSDNKEDS